MHLWLFALSTRGAHVVLPHFAVAHFGGELAYALHVVFTVHAKADLDGVAVFGPQLSLLCGRGEWAWWVLRLRVGWLAG